MPRSKHRKKPKAIPRKIVRRTTPTFEGRFDAFGLPLDRPTAPVDPDRLQRAEDYARAFAADDPAPIIEGVNPPTDPRVIAALGMV